MTLPQLLSLKNHAFARLLGFRVLLVLAYQITAVVVGWHIYQLTHDPWSLGLVGLAEAIPYFCCALFAGYAVDHYSRRLFGVLAACMLCLNAMTLTAVSVGWIGSNPVAWIYGSIIFIGIGRSFIAPTYSALFALIFPREQVVRATGVGSSIFQFGLVVGPAIGGVVVGWANISVAYGMASVFCLGAAITLLTLRVEEPPPPEGAPILTSIAEGLRFVYGNQVLLAAMSLDMFGVLFGGAIALLPAFIHDIYHTGPEALGILRAAPAAGAVMMGLLLVRHPIHDHMGRWLLGAVAGFGLSIIAFALSPHFWVAAIFLLISGAMDGISIVLRTSIMQLATPDAMRGRVSAINGIFIGSSNELGAFESGLAARLMGLVPSVIFGGMMTLTVVGITARLAPKLRQLQLKHLH